MDIANDQVYNNKSSAKKDSVSEKPSFLALEMSQKDQSFMNQSKIESVNYEAESELPTNLELMEEPEPIIESEKKVQTPMLTEPDSEIPLSPSQLNMRLELKMAKK